MTTLNQYNKLVDLTYAAGLSDTGWMKFCQYFSTVIEDSILAVQGHDLKSNTNIGVITDKLDSEFLASYVDYYAELNPWIAGFAKMPVGRAFEAWELMDKESLKKTEFYNDWVKPQDDISSGAGVVICRKSDRILTVAVNLHAAEEETKQPELLNLLKLLSPHLQRAFNIQRDLLGPGSQTNTFLSHLDRVKTAVFLVDSSGRIMHCNTFAEAMMGSGNLLASVQYGILRFIHPDTQRQYKELLRRFGNREYMDFNSEFLAHSQQNGEMFRIAVSPFSTSSSENILSEFAKSTLPTAIVTISSTALDVDERIDSVASRHGLSPAEKNLSIALVHGKSLSNYAEENQLSIHTVRSHLKSVFSKMGVRKQVELTALLTGIGNEIF